MSSTSRSHKSEIRCGLVFPVRRIRTLLRRGNYAEEVGTGASIYLSAVLEYLVRQVLTKTVDRVDACKKKRIEPKLIIEAIMTDPELLKLWDGVIVSETSLEQYLGSRG